MLLVALLAAVLAGVLVRQATIEATEDAAQQNLRTDAQILNELQALSLFTGSWNGAQPLVEALAEITGQRIALTDLGGTTLVDSDPDTSLPAQSSALIDPNDEALQTIDFASFLVLDELLVADVVAEAEEQLEDCLAAAGVNEELLFDDDLASITPEAAECLDDFDRLTALPSAEPALLYLGFPADELVDFGAIDPVAILMIVGVVAAAAAAAASLLARRISTPVRALTGAVAQLGSGDMTVRADDSSTGEIGNLARAFNDMAADLQHGEQTRQRMVRDVAHELRNPIGVLQGNLEAAQDGIFAADEEMLAMLHGETVHLSALVEDLQQLALADAGSLVIRPELTDLHQLAEEVVSGYRPVAADAGITLTLDGSSAPVNADPTRIRQVILNLVTNGVAYTPSGGTVQVSAVSVPAPQDTSATVELRVLDTGHGLDRSEQEQVFDRFWRADDSRNRHTGGAGLGLSICKQLVEAHHGSISVESTPGEGTTFTVSMPTNLSKP
ncbi:MAG: HAMP domain-containing protein [Actinomycetia bacterium]|nr:HAMP domain-containing protein [Actinomycetes bacterium]